MRAIQWIAIVVTGIVCLVAFDRGSASESLESRVDVSAFLDANDPSIVIAIISAQTRFRTNIDQQRFERFVTNRNADYAVRINRPEQARAVARSLSELVLVNAKPPHQADLRYRVQFFDGESQIAVLYVGPFGEVLHEERYWEPQSGAEWLHAQFNHLAKEFVR